ncbi:MAG: KpsF/GutQ family sugar-phosphate isomerase [Elusimicrobia bacterium]|nr:KpsF/GutQ family sugar-phosphate isomerase [Elusimicrobiota bacterium]
MAHRRKNALADIRRVLKLEARALERASASVDGRYARAVERLAACRGKVVLTGVGKSGLVAQKIAATFSSTGTPSVFLDAAEALHGGLGMVQRSDLVLAVGKSGESDELNALLPALRQRGVPVIALTANPRSTLARAAELVLETPVGQEACPLDLAPTTSTTVAMALGDALAVALMRRRGFDSRQFASNHPAGRLGRRLNLRVCDVMRAGSDNPAVRADAPVSELLTVITRKQAGAACVVDAHRKLVGFVTDYDLRKALASGADLLRRPLRSLMNAKPTTIRETASVAEAVSLMEDRPNPFNVLPVVDARGRSVGLVQIHDLRARGL